MTRHRFSPLLAGALAFVVLAAACSSSSGGDTASTNPGSDSTEQSVPTTVPAPVRETLHLPVTPAGERPPQFLVVSFDGAGGQPLWAYWRDVGRRANASFTFFLSGIYLLDPSNKEHYQPPRHSAGASGIGFNDPPAGADPWQEISALLGNLDEAWFEGHEIGSHFNGHFCGTSSSAVGAWTTADWTQEINEFNKLLTNVAVFNPLPPDAPVLPFGPADIKGARTPCLEGQKDQLYAAEVAAGYRYDASGTGVQFNWPKRVGDGLWDMPVAAIPMVGRSFNTLMLDYNFYANQSGGTRGDPAQFPAWEEQTRVSWQNAFDAAYTGNRAPVIVGNHFNEWNGGIYKQALTDLVLNNCGRPEVYCISHVELADWLDAEPADALASFQAGSFPKVGPDGLPVPTSSIPATATTTKSR